ncbi:MAG: hypothetical protein AB1426_06325 [Bacillota bacterium]
MIVLFLIRLRERLLHTIKIFALLALFSVLLAGFYGVIKESETVVGGKAQYEMDHRGFVATENGEQGMFDKFISKLKQYYRGN